MSQQDTPIAARDHARTKDRSESSGPGVERPTDEYGQSSESATSQAPRRAASSTGRWWVVVAVTSVFSLPFGWLLSYAAQLPFYLGLFFFALFGLVIGAVACRLASPAGPFPRRTVTVGTTIIIASCWLTSIVTESLDFPRAMAEKAVVAASTLGDHDLPAFRESVAETSREIIRSGPGGPVLGYVRWVVTDGHVKANTIAGVRRALRPVHRRQGWVIRVVLSIALLSFGIATQTWALRPNDQEPGVEPSTTE